MTTFYLTFQAKGAFITNMNTNTTAKNTTKNTEKSMFFD